MHWTAGISSFLNKAHICKSLQKLGIFVYFICVFYKICLIADYVKWLIWQPIIWSILNVWVPLWIFGFFSFIVFTTMKHFNELFFRLFFLTSFNLEKKCLQKIRNNFWFLLPKKQFPESWSVLRSVNLWCWHNTAHTHTGCKTQTHVETHVETYTKSITAIAVIGDVAIHGG